MKPKIFISGKITSDPNYKAKFAAAEAFLPDYHRSPGAELELNYCCYTDKSIHHFKDGIAKEPEVISIQVKITRHQEEAKP